MKLSDFTLVVIAVGLLLFAASFVYPSWSGSAQRQWTEQDAQEYQEINRKLHGADYQYAAERQRNPNAEMPPELARLTDSHLQKAQQLENAQNAGQGVARILYFAGIGLVVIGGVIYIASRGGGDD